jgi:crotonobetainyl-CoA:carnitine CoA-transferase CaiB-like acyl-CoA transferase
LKPRPLEGVRILDVATFLAAPFCGVILADFGAEVIKVEQPDGGDPLRKFGTKTECGDTLVWMSEARNKKYVTLDLRTAEGAALFRQLVAKSDAVLENFRPGTMEKWGLGYEALRAINARLVMLRISAYGQDGPYRDKPGFARVAHAFSGLSYLAGESGRAPVVPGSTSIGDYASGMWGAIGVLLALRTAESTGEGQAIDIGLYESIFRLMDELAPAYHKYGIVRERQGPDVPFVVPHGHWQCSDGKWLAIACSSEKMFERFAGAMQRPDLAASADYGTNAARVKNREAMNAIVAAWAAGLTRAEALAACDSGQVACGPLLSIEEIFQDPQYLARRNFELVNDARVADLMLPTQPLRLSETPARFDHAGGALGKDTDEVLGRILGLSAGELAQLRANGVI